MGKFDNYINVTAPLHSATIKGKLGNANEIFLEGDTKNIENEITEINSRHENLNKKHDTLSSKHESLSRTVQGIAATGGANTATNVTYNNDTSGLNAENVQDAIDELQGSKFDKTSILQESGNAEDKVMSQKAVSDKLSDLTSNDFVSSLAKDGDTLEYIEKVPNKRLSESGISDGDTNICSYDLTNLEGKIIKINVSSFNRLTYGYIITSITSSNIVQDSSSIYSNIVKSDSIHTSTFINEESNILVTPSMKTLLLGGNIPPVVKVFNSSDLISYHNDKLPGAGNVDDALNAMQDVIETKQDKLDIQSAPSTDTDTIALSSSIMECLKDFVGNCKIEELSSTSQLSSKKLNDKGIEKGNSFVIAYDIRNIRGKIVTVNSIALNAKSYGWIVVSSNNIENIAPEEIILHGKLYPTAQNTYNESTLIIPNDATFLLLSKGNDDNNFAKVYMTDFANNSEIKQLRKEIDGDKITEHVIKTDSNNYAEAILGVNFSSLNSGFYCSLSNEATISKVSLRKRNEDGSSSQLYSYVPEIEEDGRYHIYNFGDKKEVNIFQIRCSSACNVTIYNPIISYIGYKIKRNEEKLDNIEKKFIHDGLRLRINIDTPSWSYILEKNAYYRNCVFTGNMVEMTDGVTLDNCDFVNCILSCNKQYTKNVVIKHCNFIGYNSRISAGFINNWHVLYNNFIISDSRYPDAEARHSGNGNRNFSAKGMSDCRLIGNKTESGRTGILVIPSSQTNIFNDSKYFMVENISTINNVIADNVIKGIGEEHISFDGALEYDKATIDNIEGIVFESVNTGEMVDNHEGEEQTKIVAKLTMSLTTNYLNVNPWQDGKHIKNSPLLLKGCYVVNTENSMCYPIVAMSLEGTIKTDEDDKLNYSVEGKYKLTIQIPTIYNYKRELTEDSKATIKKKLLEEWKTGNIVHVGGIQSRNVISNNIIDGIGTDYVIDTDDMGGIVLYGVCLSNVISNNHLHQKRIWFQEWDTPVGGGKKISKTKIQSFNVVTGNTLVDTGIGFVSFYTNDVKKINIGNVISNNVVIGTHQVAGIAVTREKDIKLIGNTANWYILGKNDGVTLVGNTFNGNNKEFGYFKENTNVRSDATDTIVESYNKST